MGKRKANAYPSSSHLEGEDSRLPTVPLLKVAEEYRQRQQLAGFGNFTVWEPGDNQAPIAAFRRGTDAERFALLDRLEAAARAVQAEGRTADAWRELELVLEKLRAVT